jgi:EAL domain-containing protein (putative c-di-GMP-specific phosphodiesterase class I)
MPPRLPDTDVRHVRRDITEDDLRRAVERDELDLHYQPIVEILDGRVVAFEALLRWRHPLHGLLSARDFVTAAERAPFVGPWLLDRVCTVLAALPDAIGLSANWSASMLGPGTARAVEGVLAARSVAPGRLTLEITERHMADDGGAVELHSLRQLGVHVALDNMGCGTASLSTLTRLPFDVVKIHQSFLRPGGGDAGSLIAAALRIAESLGVRAIATAVERAHELDLLRRLGCELAQGHLLGRPMPEDRMRAAVTRCDAA